MAYTLKELAAMHVNDPPLKVTISGGMTPREREFSAALIRAFEGTFAADDHLLRTGVWDPVKEWSPDGPDPYAGVTSNCACDCTRENHGSKRYACLSHYCKCQAYRPK